MESHEQTRLEITWRTEEKTWHLYKQSLHRLEEDMEWFISCAKFVLLNSLILR